jgi:hypothetical protein
MDTFPAVRRSLFNPQAQVARRSSSTSSNDAQRTCQFRKALQPDPAAHVCRNKRHEDSKREGRMKMRIVSGKVAVITGLLAARARETHRMGQPHGRRLGL